MCAFPCVLGSSCLNMAFGVAAADVSGTVNLLFIYINVNVDRQICIVFQLNLGQLASAMETSDVAWKK